MHNEYELITKSIATAADAARQAFYEEVAALSLGKPSAGKRNLQQLLKEHLTMTILEVALGTMTEKNFTHEKLLKAIAENASEDTLQIVRKVLESIPTPETLMTGSVKESVLMRAKVIKCLPGIPITQGHEDAAAVNVGTDKKKVCVDVGLLTEIAPIAPRLTVFDLSVMQAAASIFASGTKTFSTNQLYRALTGADAHTRISSKATLEAVKKSLGILQATMITIDASRQATFGGYSKFCWNKTRFTGYLLPMSKIETAYYSGNKSEVPCDCWRILAKPPLLAYATTINHIATIPQEVKRLPKGVSATVNNICIRDTLLYYICLNRGKNTKLNYSTLFKAAGVDASDRRIYHKMKKAADSLLQHWQEIGFIADNTNVI